MNDPQTSPRVLATSPHLIAPSKTDYCLVPTVHDTKIPLKVPLSDVVYERYSAGQHASFYIQALPSRRQYPNGIRRFDKLFLIGIYNHRTAQKLDFAFSWQDQTAMLKTVCGVMVKPSERQKLVEQFQSALNEYIQHGTIHTAFAGVEP